MQNQPRSAVPCGKIIVLISAVSTVLLARRIREARVYCELLPYNTPWVQIKREPCRVDLKRRAGRRHPAPA